MEDETNPELDQLFEDDPGSLAEIGEEDVDDLDIANVGTKIWLVKVNVDQYANNVIQRHTITRLKGLPCLCLGSKLLS